MDSTNTPQSNPVVQQPVVAPVTSVTHPVQPAVQEAQATMTVPNQESSITSKGLIGFLIFAVLAVLGALGYFVYVRSNSQPAESTTMMVTPAPTAIMASPTPKNEVEAVDQLDTSFPATDAASIQNDLQGL